MREDYNVTIIKTMNDLTAKERIRVKKANTSAIKLDEVTDGENSFVIENIDNFALLKIHNEHAENPDYEVLVIFNGDQAYATGSTALMNSFFDIVDEMYGEQADWGIECFKIPSRNYKGKFILTCNII